MRLEGRKDLCHQLVEALPACPVVLNAYLRYLSNVGRPALPEALVVVQGRLVGGDPVTTLASGDSSCYLDQVLRPLVYGEPTRLKRDAEVLQAVLFILDAIVEGGSSSAFRIVDDFVTPLT